MMGLHILKSGQVAETRDGTRYILYKPNSAAHIDFINLNGECEFTTFIYNEDLENTDNPNKNIIALYNNWCDMLPIWFAGYRVVR